MSSFCCPPALTFCTSASPCLSVDPELARAGVAVLRLPKIPSAQKNETLLILLAKSESMLIQ